MASRQIKAILFDLGETLLNFGKVDTSALFTEAGRLSYKYLKQLNQPVGPFFLYKWRYLTGLKFHHLLSNITKKDFDSLAVLKRYGKKKSIDLTDAQWEHLNWLWYLPLSRKVHIESDLTETLKKLISAGLKLGIVSNTFVHGSSLDRQLQETGVLDYFNPRLYSYQFQYRKPDRRIFLEAANQMQIDPENVMFVGDRIDTDINGALAAGMKPVMKTAYTNKNRKPVNGVPIINAVSELPAIVEKINRNNKVTL